MKCVVILALLLPIAARAQIALYVMNGSTATPAGTALDLGRVAAGDTVSVRLRVKNNGTSVANISRFSADGIGFTIDRPSLPFPIAPGSAQDVLLSFRANSPAVYSANVQVNSQINNVSVIAVATVVNGPSLTVFPVCTGSDGPPPAIDFGRVQAGQLRLCNFYLQNTSAQPMPIAKFQVTGSAFRQSSGPKAPFTIAPGVILPVGKYDYAVYGLDWTLNPSAPLSFVLRGDFGPFYNGTRNGGSINLTYRRGAALSTSMLFDYNDVHLDQGNFVRQLIGNRVAYFFTPRVFAQSLVQYNNQAHIWSANARFGWLSTAGTGLYVVFNDGENADGYFNWGQPQTRSFIVKYTRQIAAP